MNIAILTGGISTEREVALRSAKNLKTWIENSGYTCISFDLPQEIDSFITQYKRFDSVIPLFHGKYGEDGQITAFLKTLGCNVAYSPFETHALCIDKYRTNLVVGDIGIKIPKTWIIPENTSHDRCLPQVFPLIVKPNTGGSSITTSKVDSEHELISAIELISHDDALIQEYIPGREFTVAVYHDTLGYHTLPIIEIRTISGDFFDFEEKYGTDGSNEVFLEGELSLQEALNDQSVKITTHLKCRGIVRIDYRYDGENIYFLEVNTIPGFTEASLVPKMWKHAGKTEKEFVEMMVG